MFSTGMMVTREEESDSDVRVSVLMLGLTDISLVVALGFIVRNADLGASGSERGALCPSVLDYLTSH